MSETNDTEPVLPILLTQNEVNALYDHLVQIDGGIPDLLWSVVKKLELRQAVARRLRDGRWLINTGDDKSNEKIHLAAADAAIAEIREALANNEDMEEAAIMTFSRHEIEIMRIGADHSWPIDAIAALLQKKVHIVKTAVIKHGIERKTTGTPRCKAISVRDNRPCTQPTHHPSGLCRFHQ